MTAHSERWIEQQNQIREEKKNFMTNLCDYIAMQKTMKIKFGNILSWVKHQMIYELNMYILSNDLMAFNSNTHVDFDVLLLYAFIWWKNHDNYMVTHQKRLYISFIVQLPGCVQK